MKKEELKDELFNMLISCYPPDMENFDTITESQAYRLLKEFWEKYIDGKKVYREKEIEIVKEIKNNNQKNVWKNYKKFKVN